MAISQRHVQQLERITADLGDLLMEMRPSTPKEWDAFDSAVTAHKNLRKMDTDSLRQLPLSGMEEPAKAAKPKKDCPRCKGSGTFTDPAAPNDPGRPCICKDIEKVVWPAVKADWAKILEPVSV